MARCNVFRIYFTHATGFPLFIFSRGLKLNRISKSFSLTAYSVLYVDRYSNASSYRRSSSRSTHPPLGNGLSHRLCKCTAKIFCSAISSPPPSSKPYPSVHCPSARSGVNGSGTLLSSLQARGSLKQKGRILKGGIDAARRRRQSRR